MTEHVRLIVSAFTDIHGLHYRRQYTVMPRKSVGLTDASRLNTGVLGGGSIGTNLCTPRYLMAPCIIGRSIKFVHGP